jgi:hypothetical protein
VGRTSPTRLERETTLRLGLVWVIGLGLGFLS